MADEVPAAHWELELLAWNVKHGVSDDNLDYLQGELLDSTRAMVFLSETRERAQLRGKLSVRSTGLVDVTPTAADSRATWLVTEELRPYLHCHDFGALSGVAAGVSLRHGGRTTHFLGAYWPPGDEGGMLSIVRLSGLLKGMLAECGEGGIVLCGDLNANAGVAGSGSAAAADRWGTLRDMLEEQGLRRIHGEGEAADPTFFRSHKSSQPAGALDHVMLSPDLAASATPHDIHYAPESRSDHAPVACTLRLPAEAPPAIEAVREVRRWEIAVYGSESWQRYRDVLLDELHDLIGYVDAQGERSATPAEICHVWKLLREAVTSAADAVFPKKEKELHHPAVWRSDSRAATLRQAAKRARRRRKAAAQGGTPARIGASQRQVRRAQARLRRYMTKKARKRSKEGARKIADTLGTHASRAGWRIVRRLVRPSVETASTLAQVRGPDGVLAAEGEESVEVAAEVMTAMFQKGQTPTAVERENRELEADQGGAAARIRRGLEGLPAAPELDPVGAPVGVSGGRVRGEFPHRTGRVDDWGEFVPDSGDEGGKPYVMRALDKVNLGASPGSDGLVVELLAWVDSHAVAVVIERDVPEGSAVAEGVGDPGSTFRGRAVLSRIVTWLFRQMFAAGYMPPEWKVGSTVLLWKGKGDRADLAGYRTITCGSTMEKWYAHALLHGVEGWATLRQRVSVDQCGFQPHRSTEDAQLALVSMLQERHGTAKANNENVTHLVFVDFRAAYDSVDHEALLLMLELVGAGVLVPAVADMLEGRTTTVRVAGGRTKLITSQFPVLTGSKSSTGVDASITLVSARFELESLHLCPHLGQVTGLPGLGAAGVVSVRGTL